MGPAVLLDFLGALEALAAVPLVVAVEVCRGLGQPAQRQAGANR